MTTEQTERRTVPMTALFKPSEAAFLKDLMWQTRQPLSGWLREIAMEAADRLATEKREATPGR